MVCDTCELLLCFNELRHLSGTGAAAGEIIVIVVCLYEGSAGSEL